MWPGGPLLSMAVVRPLHLLCFGQRAYLYRGAGLGHAGLDPVRSIPLAGGLTNVLLEHIPNAAIINSLGATKLRLVVPSALVLSLFASRPQPAACLLACCPA